MKRSQLEFRVKKEFSMDLYDFLKQKVEIEALYNYEIARLLHVKTERIAKLKRSFGLKRKNGFSRNFQNKYGPGAIDTFKDIIEKPDNSLSDVAKHFGFSREYARQIYQKIFGYPYTETLKRKQLEKKRRKIEAQINSEKFKCLLMLRQKMWALGFNPLIRSEKSNYRVNVNGNKLAFRFCSRPSIVGDKQYYRIIGPKDASSDCDFIVCLCRNDDEHTYFIIPWDAMPRTGICLIVVPSGSDESKYSKFKEAWNQLNH